MLPFLPVAAPGVAPALDGFHGLVSTPAPPAADFSSATIPPKPLLFTAAGVALHHGIDVPFPGLVPNPAPPLADFASQPLPGRPLLFTAAGVALHRGIDVPFPGLVSTPAPPLADYSSPGIPKPWLFRMGKGFRGGLELPFHGLAPYAFEAPFTIPDESAQAEFLVAINRRRGRR